MKNLLVEIWFSGMDFTVFEMQPPNFQCQLLTGDTVSSISYGADAYRLSY